MGLKIAAIGGLLFLHLPILLIFLYAFTTEERTYQFPPPGLTTQWFAVAWLTAPTSGRRLYLSLKVAAISTVLAMILGTLVAAAMAQGAVLRPRPDQSLLIILPIALPGVITGMSLRSAFGIMDIPFSTWTIVLGHATFCIVIVYNNAVARMRRLSGGIIGGQLPTLAPMPSRPSATSCCPTSARPFWPVACWPLRCRFDEVIVTTFTAGQQSTLPIWMLNELVRPRQRPVTNVVAIVVFVATFLPILIAYYLTRGGSETAGMGK